MRKCCGNRTLSRPRLVSLLAFVLFSGAFSLKAQEQRQPPPHALGLLEAVRVTLFYDPVIQLQDKEVEFAEGRLQEERGRFDTRLSSALIHELQQITEPELSLANVPPGGQASTSLERVVNNETTYRVALDKPTRSGVVVGPSLEMTRSDQNISTLEPQNRAEVNFGVIVPLGRGLGSRAATAEERAAKIDLEGARFNLDHTVALRVLNTTFAYWSYRAAFERLEILKTSEQRSQELLQNTAQLVEAQEVAGAELDQLRANLGDKTRARVAADQELLEARQALGLAMGLHFAQIGTLPPAAEPFPAELEPAIPPSQEPDGLFRVALEQRSDLRSARMAEDSAEALLYLARNRLKPQVDLTVRAGYGGYDQGGEFRDWFGALGENVAGVNALAALTFDWPPRNQQARGRLVQQQSVYDQRLIRSADLARNIQSSVFVAWQKVRSVVAELKEAATAEEAYGKAVANEREKRRLGLASFSDVLFVQDRLLAASLERLSAQQQHANALAGLRFEVGEILQGTPAARSVGLRELTTLPSTTKP